MKKKNMDNKNKNYKINTNNTNVINKENKNK